MLCKIIEKILSQSTRTLCKLTKDFNNAIICNIKALELTLTTEINRPRKSSLYFSSSLNYFSWLQLPTHTFIFSIGMLWFISSLASFVFIFSFPVSFPVVYSIESVILLLLTPIVQHFDSLYSTSYSLFTYITRIVGNQYLVLYTSIRFLLLLLLERLKYSKTKKWSWWAKPFEKISTLVVN